jgi:hypothetical protein
MSFSSPYHFHPSCSCCYHVAVMVERHFKNITSRSRGASRVFIIAMLATATVCFIVSRSSGLKPSQSLAHGFLLGDPFEPDAQDEQSISQPDHSERLQSIVYGRDTDSGSSSAYETSVDARRDTDEVRQLRRIGDYTQRSHYGDDRHRSNGDGQRSGPTNTDVPITARFANKADAQLDNYNVNIINGEDSDLSSPLSYISSPVAGLGSDIVGGDITSSLNQNIRDIQKLQRQFSAPQRARRRSRLVQLNKDDKMLQTRLLDTLKLQESQTIAETSAIKRLAMQLQRMRERSQQELDQRATTIQVNDVMFDLKRLAAMQKAEYKSLMQTKAQPGPPGLPGPPGPPGANGHDGLNGSPGSIKQLIPIPQNRLAAAPAGHWADQALFRRGSPATGSAGLAFLTPSLPPAIPPPYLPFPNRVETLPNGATCVLPPSHCCAYVFCLKRLP